MKRALVVRIWQFRRLCCPARAANKVAHFFIDVYQTRLATLNAWLWRCNPTLFAYPFIDGLSAIASQQG